MYPCTVFKLVPKFSVLLAKRDLHSNPGQIIVAVVDVVDVVDVDDSVKTLYEHCGY